MSAQRYIEVLKEFERAKNLVSLGSFYKHKETGRAYRIQGISINEKNQKAMVKFSFDDFSTIEWLQYAETFNTPSKSSNKDYYDVVFRELEKAKTLLDFGEKYMHTKTGGLYRVNGIAFDEEEREPKVKYNSLDVPQVEWLRDLKEFIGPMDDSGTEVPRFQIQPKSVIGEITS